MLNKKNILGALVQGPGEGFDPEASVNGRGCLGEGKYGDNTARYVCT